MTAVVPPQAQAAAVESPWNVDVDPFPTANVETGGGGWFVGNFGTPAVKNAHKKSDGTQNAEIAWDVVLAAGTWTLELMHAKATDNGIYTVSVGGTVVGTIDGYNAALSSNNLSALSFVVGVSGKVRISLKMLTKNAASSAYTSRVQGLKLRRTA